MNNDNNDNDNDNNNNNNNNNNNSNNDNNCILLLISRDHEVPVWCPAGVSLSHGLGGLLSHGWQLL